MISHLLTSVILAALFSSVHSTGTLLLEFTSSKDCVLNITSDFSSDFMLLPTDSPRTVTFHTIPKETIRVFKYDVVDVKSRSEFGFYTLKVSSKRKIYVFGDILISIKATFECDAGFTGRRCDLEVTTTTTTSSTSSIATSTVPTTTTTVTTTTTNVPTTSALPITQEIQLELLVIVSIFTLVMSAAILCILCCWCRRSTHNISESEVKCISPLPQKLPLFIESPRYTAAPFSSVMVSDH